ncbi:MAG: hypothetical protein BIFFINMI_01218 [Phycisphaerae bacterium]|nr:hypothetical protein [Phycisphaerae bacterium]
MKRGRGEPRQPPAQPDESAQRDAALVVRTLAGDRTAFDDLVRAHEKQALAVAYRLLNRVADAQEVVQDALLKAYRALDTLENPQVFGSWLLRIVSNLSLNYRRSRARRTGLSLEDSGRQDSHGGQNESLLNVLTSDQQLPEEELMTEELRGRIREALEELPDRQRTALVLFSIEKMPQKQVADVLGCSVEAVKWHVFSARKKLKEKLKLELSDLMDSDDEQDNAPI